jgi:MFS family permease
MVTFGSLSSFGIFFKPIMEELESTRAVISGASSLSMIMGGLLGVVMGRLSDRSGPRVVITICGLLSALGYMLMSQIQTVWQLYLFYGVMIGAGGVGIFAPLLSTLARWFVKTRSMITGIVLAGSGVGMLIMPLVINRLISAYDWRVSYLILGIIILIVVVLTAQFLKRDPSQVGQVAYGESNTTGEGLELGTKALSFTEAILTRQLWLLFAVMFCFGFSFTSIRVHLVPYATDLGISATGAATILATIGGATIIGQTMLGSTGDKIGYRGAFLTGFVIMSLAVFTLMLGRELWMFYLSAVLFGLALGDCMTQESPLMAWLFGLEFHGLFIGLCSFSYTVGAAIGPVISGYIFDVTGNYQFAFLVYAALSVAAIILTIFLKPATTELTPKTLNSKAL